MSSESPLFLKKKIEWENKKSVSKELAKYKGYGKIIAYDMLICQDGELSNYIKQVQQSYSDITQYAGVYTKDLPIKDNLEEIHKLVVSIQTTTHDNVNKHNIVRYCNLIPLYKNVSDKLFAIIESMLFVQVIINKLKKYFMEHKMNIIDSNNALIACAYQRINNAIAAETICKSISILDLCYRRCYLNWGRASSLLLSEVMDNDVTNKRRRIVDGTPFIDFSTIVALELYKGKEMIESLLRTRNYVKPIDKNITYKCKITTS
jgi:hypothetical protein